MSDVGITNFVHSKEKHQGFYLYLLLTAVALVSFLISLDGFIVNVAIPTISGELGVREDVGTWMITLFSMSATVFVPVSGYFSRRVGNIPIFIFGLICFIIASFLSGVSPSFGFLLVCRVFQGASAGLLTPVSLTLIINNFPPEKRSVGIGFWSFFVMVGPAMGPMIGGWLSNYHWPFMFFLNIPISLFSLAIVLLFLYGKKEEKTAYPLDWIGIALLFLWVGALQVAMNRWNVDDWFRSSFIISLFIISGISLLFFLVWELFHPEPFIDFNRILKRNFFLASLTTAIGMGTLFSSFVLDSLWVQKVLGYTPAWAGLTLSPVGIFPLIFYPLMGRVVGKLDPRIWVISSFILYACTFFWLSQVTTYTPFWQLAMPRLVQGIGFAAFTVPNAALVIKGVQHERLTHVISLFSFIRMLAVGFGVAGAVTIWILRETFYQTRLTSRAAANSALFQELVSPFEGLTHSLHKSYALSYETLVAESSTLALADIYYVFGWLFIALCGIVFFYKPSQE